MLDWISNITDIKWVVAEGPHNPYIPVLHIRDFKNILINQLVDSKRITGIIVIQPSEEPLNSGFSPETSCPNDGVNYYNDNRFRNESFGHCSAQKWNPQNPAMDLLFRNFDFPILLVTRKQDIDNIKKCIKKYGRSDENPEPIWPLCSAQIFTRMRAAKDSVTCMRRNTFVNPLDTPLRYCDPLQSFNVFSPLFTINSKSTISNSSLIVLAARMDALTFFYDKVPGADSPVTGLVVLLSVIETLSRVMSELQRERKGDSNVLFAIFNGEAYDYIGSGRMAYDLTNSQFNPKSKSEYSLNLPSFNFQELAYFIELNQLAAYSGAQELWMHADPISLRDSTVKKKVDDLVQTFKLHQQKLAVNLVDNVALPPSSFQMFLREQPNLAGLVLTNHKGIYANRYYHSIMDNYLNIKANVSESTSNTEENTNELVQHLVSMSTLVSKSVYQMITTKSDLNITANATTINNLLYCFLKNITCSHFLRFFSPDDAEIVKKNLRGKILSIKRVKSINPFYWVDVPTVPMYVGGYIQTKSPAWWLREFITLEIADYLGKKSKNVSFGECFTRKESKNVSNYRLNISQVLILQILFL